MHEAEEDLALLQRAAKAAGEIAMRHFRRDPKTWHKPDEQGPVTAADIEVDRMLGEELRAARPDYGWLSEESTVQRPRACRRFVIDPIDGTRAFIAGEPGFSHSLAVVENGRPVTAVVHLPARGETYSAQAGQGAWSDGRRLAVSPCTELQDATVLCAKRQLSPQYWPEGPPPLHQHFRPSLAWRLCLVAAGHFDLMLTLRESWDWDLAGGSLVASEAGAVVTDRHGRPLRFDRERPMQPGVIAAPPALHRQLIPLLKGAVAPR